MASILILPHARAVPFTRLSESSHIAESYL